jgi:hypothetical protein
MADPSPGVAIADGAPELRRLLEILAGHVAPLPTADLHYAVPRLLPRGRGLGYSQFNELLLLLGYDRITHAFFQYLVDGRVEYQPGAAFSSFSQLRDGIDRFRKIALVLFGNIKFAFKRLSRNAEELESWVNFIAPIEESEFANRHDPIYPLQQIGADDTYYLGYIIQDEINARLKANPNDEQARRDEEKRRRLVDIGVQNHHAYLASDHMDVYVATSMRSRHEYLHVNELGNGIFTHPRLRSLKLRWFDPTQVFCADRIDKGLAEALMLKRARCTIYLAQEIDTLGKDSELASTLAQGKPVIAYVPHVDNQFVPKLLQSLRILNESKSEIDLILDQLQIFEPAAAWRDSQVRQWLEDRSSADVDAARERLLQRIRAHYDKRAEQLRETHPLGIQVNLATGVANGVLVVRTVDECAELVHRVITNQLEFDIETKYVSNRGYLLLRETISKSIFRVVTGDAMLMNTFWNFYLEPAE